VRYLFGIGNVSEPHDVFSLIFTHMCSIDFLIDKKELIRNKVLEANCLCGSDMMYVIFFLLIIDNQI
jgi:hypothetical protein